MNIAFSKNKIPIRLSDERWHHITTGHPEIADYYYEILDTIENPKSIFQGDNQDLIAIGFHIASTRKFIVAVYKEVSQNDGFVLTAYLSKKEQKFEKKNLVWKHM